jgi:hypothetical protein
MYNPAKVGAIYTETGWMQKNATGDWVLDYSPAYAGNYEVYLTARHTDANGRIETYIGNFTIDATV